MKRFYVDDWGDLIESNDGDLCMADDASDARVTAIVAGVIASIVLFAAGFVAGSYSSMLGYL